MWLPTLNITIFNFVSVIVLAKYVHFASRVMWKIISVKFSFDLQPKIFES